MSLINPFKSLKYNTEKVYLNDVIAPPYDIISREQQKQLHAKSEYNVINLILGEVKDTDDDTNNRYTRAKESLDKWLDDGIIVEDAEECFYILKQEYEIYRQANGSYENTKCYEKKYTFGIIANVELHEWFENVVLPHEKTLDKPKKDRLKLLKATNVNLSPIYIVYEDDQKNIDEFIHMYTQSNNPIFKFTDTENVVNTVWSMSVEKCGAFTDVLNQQKLYIADGHHRYETALEYKKYMQEKTGDTKNKTASYNYIMAYITGALEERISIIPTHRMLIHIGAEKIKSLIDEKLGQYFDIQKVDSYEKAAILMNESYDKHSFILYTKESNFLFIVLKDRFDKQELLNIKSKALADLDVKILHTLILENMLGITEKEQASGDHIRYTRDDSFAISEVDNGNCDAAVILERTPLKSIIAVANDKEVMPQKSTYFYPKLPSGMVMRKL